MKSRIINKIKSKMKLYLDENQLVILDETLRNVLKDFDLVEAKCEFDVNQSQENSILLMNFLASKHVEGCSERTIMYYHSTIDKMLNVVNKKIEFISTDDLRKYLADYKDNNKMKEMTISIQEFIRRFLLHILPPHFMKIRYYGILGNKNKKKKLLKCKILTRTKVYTKKKFPTLEPQKQT